MAKKTGGSTTAPSKKASGSATAPSLTAAVEIHDLMVELANGVLTEFFFDPEREDQYEAAAAELKKSRLQEIELSIEHQEIDAGPCNLRLLALRPRLAFRLVVTGPSFEVAIEGVWDIDEEAFKRPQVTRVSGTPRVIIKHLDGLADSLSEQLLDGDVIAELLAGIEQQMSAEGDDGDDEDEPPAASPAERRRIATMAATIARQGSAKLSSKDAAWLEETPQSLAVILENFIHEAARPGVDPQDPSLEAYLVLLSEQLHFLRYRLDEGRIWAKRLLLDAQERMLNAALDEEIPHETWMLLAAVLTESRVPVSEDMQRRLADAGLGRDVEELPQDLHGALSEALNMIADMDITPFEILEGLQGTGAVVPTEMRCFIAMELALSAHASLRETVPLMLLDNNSSVRQQAAQALMQTANSDSVSGTALRRMIAIRSWLPVEDRSKVDAAIRAVRVGGTQPTAWSPPPHDLDVFASFVDGSAAQSIVLVYRTGRKSTVCGLLLRHGDGICDAWIREDMSRKEVTDLMKTVTGEMAAVKVDRSYADQVVQHAIATGLSAGNVPPPDTLGVAEALGAHDWRDRRLDVADEAEAEWQRLPEDARRPDTLAALHHRAAVWLEQAAIFQSWYEGGPNIEKRYRTMAPAAAAALLLVDEMEANRLAWAEKFLLVALCCKASHDPLFQAHTNELLAVARALTNNEPLASIPAMQRIADTSVMAASYRGW